MTQLAGLRFDRIGRASFRIEGSRILYTDPWDVDGTPDDADLVLLSRWPQNDVELNALQAVSRDETQVVVPTNPGKSLPGIKPAAMAPGEKLSFGAVSVESVRTESYEVASGSPSTTLGFLLTLDNIPIYTSGPTRCLPEMFQIACQIALLAVSGKACMDAQEAAEAAGRLRPRFAIPLQYGSGDRDRENAEEFGRLIRCEIFPF